MKTLSERIDEVRVEMPEAWKSAKDFQSWIYNHYEDIEQSLTIASAYLKGVEEGLVEVPSEATGDMEDGVRRANYDETLAQSAIAKMYKAALAAAPKSPARLALDEMEGG